MPDLIRSAGLLAGVLMLVLQLAACSHTVQSTRLQQSPPTDLPRVWELEQTPFFAQERYQCGPAALATLLVVRGVAVAPDELLDMVYLPAREGSVPIEMEAAARRYGLLVYPLSSELDAVLQEVAAGNPVLVLQNLGLSWWPRWHYAAVVGYDLDAGNMILRSGVTRRYVMRMGLFETTWRRGGYWARVVMPPGEFPQTAEPLPYVKAGLALEQSRQEQVALESYRAATTRWPVSTFGWMARGNLAFRLKKYDEAARSFRGGLIASPEEAVLWNNFGYVLEAQGCREQALQAVRCAIALEPDNGEYRDSLSALSGNKQNGKRCELPSCPVVHSQGDDADGVSKTP